MKLFKRKEEKRSIEDILMPKEIDSEDMCKDIANDKECVSEELMESDILGESKKEMKDNALCCFGWEEVKTERWLVKAAKIWYGIMSFLWFLLGGVTFAPIIFITNKMNVILKNKRNSILISIAIYAILMTLIVLLIISKRETAS